MENLIDLNEFLNNEIYDTNDKMLCEYLIEEYYDDIFSSEFFDFDELNESKKQEELTALREYRKIRKHLREGKQYKRVTKRFFELQKQCMQTALNEDLKWVKASTTMLTEKLISLNETETDDMLIEMRELKIDLVGQYKWNMVRQINKELREMEEFYDSNPKILAV